MHLVYFFQSLWENFWGIDPQWFLRLCIAICLVKISTSNHYGCCNNEPQCPVPLYQCYLCKKILVKIHETNVVLNNTGKTKWTISLSHVHQSHVSTLPAPLHYITCVHTVNSIYPDGDWVAFVLPIVARSIAVAAVVVVVATLITEKRYWRIDIQWTTP